MIPNDLFKKIRRIEITTNRLVTDIFAGQYHSVFKGRGIEFDEVREYQWGDDVRMIDWNVTARTGRPHVKKYVEEREMTVMFLIDASLSCSFGSTKQLKNKLAAELAAVLAFSAIRNNDKVGVIVFTNEIELYIPPRKGTKHVLRVIREILYFKPKNSTTDITKALEFLSKVTTRKSISFLISDFYESSSSADYTEQGPSYKKALAVANRRHDLIAVTLNDPREEQLADCGLVVLEDAETKEHQIVDSSLKENREIYAASAKKRLEGRNRLFNSVGMDFINVYTHLPYTKDIIRFFAKRRRRKSLA